MVESLSTNVEHLSVNRPFSKRRAIWDDEPDATGGGRGGDIELRSFCQIALGSANELEFFTLLSRDLHYLEVQQYDQLNEHILEIQRMLGSLIQKLGTKSQ